MAIIIGGGGSEVQERELLVAFLDRIEYVKQKGDPFLACPEGGGVLVENGRMVALGDVAVLRWNGTGERSVLERGAIQ